MLNRQRPPLKCFPENSVKKALRGRVDPPLEGKGEGIFFFSFFFFFTFIQEEVELITPSFFWSRLKRYNLYRSRWTLVSWKEEISGIGICGCGPWKTEGYMSRSLHKSINSIKQKVDKCDEIIYIITYYLLIINCWKKLSFNGVYVYYLGNLL